MSSVGLTSGHIDEHFDPTGLCQCPCEDCTLRTSKGCVCLDCRCDWASDDHKTKGPTP